MVSICALNPEDKCRNLIIKSNIAAGSDVKYGFISYTHNCGQGAHQHSFRDNVVHSTQIAVRMFPDPSESN